MDRHIQPISNEVRAQLLAALAKDNNAGDMLATADTDCWIGCATNYMTDGPGYTCFVYVILWAGAPSIVTTVTVDRETGEFRFNYLGG